MNDLLNIKVIDSTKIASFMRCPRRFLYEYILGWQSKYINHHLAFGIAIHSGLDVIWSAVPNVTAETVKQAVLAFEKDFDLLTNVDDAPFWRAKTRENGALALNEYVYKYLSVFKHYEVLLVEKSGEIPISEQMDTVVVKIDTIVRDLRDGLVYVVEHKTAGQKPVDIYDTRLQVTNYYHALNSCYGIENVGGVIVDVVIFYKGGTPAGKKRIAETGVSNGFEQFLVRKDRATMMDGLLTVNRWVHSIKKSYAELLHTRAPSTFPKCSESCYSYGSICPFYSMCSTSLNPLEQSIPIDMIVREWNPLKEFEQVENFKL